MNAPVRKEDSPQLWEKLHSAWMEEKKRGYVVGPGGVNYKVLTPDDDTVLFVPQSGIDGKYSDLSGGVSNVG